MCDNCYARHWKAKIGRNGLQVRHRNGRRVFVCVKCGNAQEEETPRFPVSKRLQANVLYIDLEVSKSVMVNYGLYVPSRHIRFDNLLKERYIICWSASYVRRETVWSQCVSPEAAGRYMGDLTHPEADCDKEIVPRLHALMRDADVIAGHNVKFDIKHAFTRFLYYGLEPIDLSRKKIMDTLSIARTKFEFESRSLDYISRRLGFRPKDDITNGDWNMVLRGNAATLRKIKKYNRGDVIEGKRVYEALEGWSGKKELFGARKLK